MAAPPPPPGAPESFSPRVCAVTRANAAELLPQVVAACEQASFVAIDCEMSGLWRQRWLGASYADSLDSRWARVRDSGAHLGLLQYGVCTFTWCAATQSFAARPFSFHLLPGGVRGLEAMDSGAAGEGGEALFAASTDALAFLRDNKFDFNAWVRDGLSFLSRAAEVELRHAHRLKALRLAARSLDAAPGSAEGAAAAEAEQQPPTRIIIDLPAPAEAAPAAAADAAPAAPAAPAATAAAAAAAAPAANEIRINRAADAEWYHRMLASIDEWVARVEAWGAAGASAGAAELQLETFPASALAEGGEAQPPASATAMDADDAPQRIAFPYLLLPPANGFKRKIVHTVLEARFGPPASAPVRAVWRASDNAPGTPDYERTPRLVWTGAGTRGYAAFQRCELRRSLGEVDALLDGAVGFRRVIDAVTRAGVPVVGHNCWLDFSHTVAKFVGPPSPSLPGFAQQLHSVFPRVYDTKHLTGAWKEVALDPVVTQAFYNNHSLGQAYRVVLGASRVTVMMPSKEAAAAEGEAGAAAGAAAGAPAAAAAAPAAPAPAAPAPRAPGGWRNQKRLPQDRCDVTIDWPALARVTLPPGFSNDTPAGGEGAFEETPHDAGYDAFMTGVVFARVAARLASLPPPPEAPAGAPPAPLPVHDPRAGAVPPAPPAVLATLFHPRTGATAALPPLPYLEAASDTLYCMRATRPHLTFVNLAHARALGEARRHRAPAPSPATHPGDAANTLLAARAATYRANYIHVSGLDVSVSDEALGEALARELGIDGRMIRALHRESAGSAFVALPTHEHAVAAVDAGSGVGGSGGGGGGGGGGGDGASRSGSEEAEGSMGTSLITHGLTWIMQKLSGVSTSAGAPPPAAASAAAAASATAAAEAGAEAEAASGAHAFPLAHLPPSAFTPALVRATVQQLRLGDLTIQTYASWLKEHADVFGVECAHEVVPKVFAAAEGAGAAAAAPAAAAPAAAVPAPAAPAPAAAAPAAAPAEVLLPPSKRTREDAPPA